MIFERIFLPTANPAKTLIEMGCQRITSKLLILAVLVMLTAISGLSSPTAYADAFDRHTRFESVLPDPARSFRLYDYRLDEDFRLKEEITYQASQYSQMVDVPYVWGGTSVGPLDRKSCAACRTCIEENKVPLKRQFVECKSCQSCGIDCSHLVNTVYKQSRLHIPYGSTAELLKKSHADLKRLYSLIDIGTDISQAKTGDLLLYKSHIAIFLEKSDKNTGTILHSAAANQFTQIGGIKIERKNLNRFAGRIRKILRHRKSYEIHKVESDIIAINRLFRKDQNLSTALDQQRKLSADKFDDLLVDWNFRRDLTIYPSENATNG